jgi:hypothetical protein
MEGGVAVHSPRADVGAAIEEEAGASQDALTLDALVLDRGRERSVSTSIRPVRVCPAIEEEPDVLGVGVRDGQGQRGHPVAPVLDRGSALEEEPDRGVVSAQESVLERSVAGAVRGVDPRPVGEEDPRGARMAFARRAVERHPADPVDRFDLRSVGEERLEDLGPAMPCSERQRGVSPARTCIDLRTPDHKALRRRRVAVHGGEVKRRLPQRIPPVRIGAVREQDADDVGVALPRGNVEERREAAEG